MHFPRRQAIGKTKKLTYKTKTFGLSPPAGDAKKQKITYKTKTFALSPPAGDEKKPKIMVGDGAQLCYNTFGKLASGCVLAPEHIRMQRASGVALAARRLLLNGGSFDGATLQPNYLRLSQAERERNERLQRSKGEA